MKLGQHFLKNKRQIEKIIKALDLRPGDVVVELGAGHGELTWELARHPVHVFAIEKDKQLTEALKAKNQRPKVKIIGGDLLKELSRLNSKFQFPSYKIVGNIPYYLTGYLFRVIGGLENKPSLIVFTVQKEVAERLVASPPKMNLLAASVQYWAKPEIIAFIPARDFSPSPKVDSAIVRLKVFSLCRGVENEDEYYKFIKILFKHPRKTVSNNLSFLKEKESLKKILKNLGIEENARPQSLSVEIIIQLLTSINH